MTNTGILIISIACFLIVAMICRTIIYIYKINDYTLSKLDKIRTVFKMFDDTHNKINGCSSDEHQLIINLKEQIRKLGL